MTTVATKPRRSIWSWPVRMLWKLVTHVSNRVGIIATLAIGAGLTFVGYILIATIIGAVIGVPLLVLGIFFVARGVY